MLLFAEAQFELNKRQGDDCTLREHLTSAWKMTGVAPKQLAEAPPLPLLASHLWGYFAEMSRFRGSNGFGPNPITPTGIKDWCWLTGIELDPWEIRAIALLDEAYLRKQND